MNGRPMDFDNPANDLHNILSFRPSNDPPGLTIVDHVERRQCTLRTANPIEMSEVSEDEFYFPVDRGVDLKTDHISLGQTAIVCVRNHAGLLVEELTEGESREFPSDLYSVEVTASIKLFLSFNDSFSVTVSSERATIRLETKDRLLVGARSYHKSPAGAITTTRDPEDMMSAISYFSSALKTTTSERSYPTLRGHPPTIKLGDEFSAPAILEKPTTGIRLILPPDYRSIYIASTLAYYLGATVEPGENPRIETDHGFVYHLGNSHRGFQGETERVLKQIFFLDCMTRIEGYYPVNLHERNQIENEVDIDFSALYNQSLSTQLEAYLDVSYSTIDPHIPQWKLTAHTTLSPDHVEMLPFLVNELALIRESNKNEKMRSETPHELPNKQRQRSVVRCATRSDIESAPSPSLIELGETNSLEQTWIGEGAPLGASKAMVQAFRNRLDRTPTDGSIDITVICNDLEMEAERDIADRVYGSREELPFNVTIYRELARSELREALQREADFLHYIGHIDAGGFECSDGRLDAETLDYTGIDAFFLNACSSYQQGIHLIKAGSIAGVVTLQDVINSGAERVGKSLARLLNRGFPLQPALSLARGESIMGGHYLVIGDGSLDIAQPESGIPASCKIKQLEDDKYELTYETYTLSHRGLGNLTFPYAGENNEYFLSSGETGVFKLRKEQLIDFLSNEVIPIRIGQTLTWSDSDNIEQILDFDQ